MHRNILFMVYDPGIRRSTIVQSHMVIETFRSAIPNLTGRLVLHQEF